MITTDQKNILNEYAQIKKEIKLLEAKADIINPQILEIMEQNEVEEISLSDHGVLSLGSRRTWKYPEVVSELEDELKSKKKESEQLGTASYTEKFYVIFKGKKDE